jgi:hypothetical protein
MQTFLILRHGEIQGRGKPYMDLKIEDSGLLVLIKRTFSELQLPPGIGGCIKVFQRRENLDAFDICFYSNVNGESYRVDQNDAAPGLSRFERSDFEDFPYTEQAAQRQLEAFSNQLINGQLEIAHFD